MNRIILASKSPRRVELLQQMGVVFEIIPSAYHEVLDESRDASEVAQELAVGKAMDVAQDNPDAFVIGSDTVVGLNGRQMEKPVDIADAREMLTSLAGQDSTVSTGVAILHQNNGVRLVSVATTNVFFKADSPEVQQLRETYLATGDWHDKAGGYGIQSGAAPLIDRIEGDYDTVVGLPTKLLGSMLEQSGAVRP